jgi:hypothetical protein
MAIVVPEAVWVAMVLAFGLCCALIVFLLYPVVEDWKRRRRWRRHGWFRDTEDRL